MHVRVFSPAYNVAKTIGILLEEYDDVYSILKKKGHNLEVLILNDNSNDGTHKLLDSAVKKYKKWLRIKHNETNLGNAGNIITGYTWGADSEADYVACMDADGEHSPYAMLRHLKMLESGRWDGIAGSIIFPDPHIDRKAIEKTMLGIKSLGNDGSDDVLAKALQIMEKLHQKVIESDNFNDRNMMRFWGRMQSTMAEIDGTFYIQSPGYNIYQRYRVVQVLEFFKDYQSFFAGNAKEAFPKWGLHFIMIYLISIGTGASIKAVYLECFGESPNRTPDKLLLQANAANVHCSMLARFAAERFSK
jgi:glycosyltransferase involved in cell wall biosynthesis